jgi:hypothetical protein
LKTTLRQKTKRATSRGPLHVYIFSLKFVRKVAFIKFGLINNNPEVVYSGFSITYEGKQVLVFILLSIRELNWLILIREVSTCKDLVS